MDLRQAAIEVAALSNAHAEAYPEEGGIERPVYPLIVALHALGFNATGSCGGHVETRELFPYVVICAHWYNSEDEVSQAELDEWTQEVLRLKELLAQYRRKNKKVFKLWKLVVDEQGTFGRVVLHSSCPSLLRVLIACLLSHKTRRRILAGNRLECKRFTRFLRENIFGSSRAT